MKAITIQSINLHTALLPYLAPFETSFGAETDKVALLVELTTEAGLVGWGECSIELWPGYGYETALMAQHILGEFLVPALLGVEIRDPREVPALLRRFRGNHHTRAGLEAAVWDAFAKTNDLRLTDLFASYAPPGHESQGAAVVGVSIGIQPSLEATLAVIQRRLDEGYGRVKLKIKRGWDIDVARAVRAAHPDLLLMLDANSDYRPQDAKHLTQLDEFNLLMIEQPLSHDDIYEHGRLQPQLQTRVCLDESVKTAGDLRLALQVGALGVLNLKPARVGGFSECLEIYGICVEAGLPLWVGGMLETGVGRAANLAFAALPAVNLPSDISATNRYFAEDISEPPFVLGADSTLTVPAGAGIGIEVQRERVEAAAARWRENYPYKRS
ncbi:MAG: o-succinylbenzoate synthase [Chloroflexi bacterium]|nr:o-succinylbenzoate synthase [Chloroflexota bacterium]MCY3581888.1 o-succinylbenzoate synthase [Chloroflexota bacterium]MCY3714901.1 o-succinylbenzoate synthase [Chloroflexota bacterium]MDE2650742.1 o-succinylbenzoate synthase [Chloroflexota bacterium]MXV92714.1 o-succinylbenzoate synthase [Chloroflexota bacterium]